MTYSVFWLEQVTTVHKRMSYSPYYAATETCPLLPADIIKATYLQPPPNSILSTTNMIARHARDLQCYIEDFEHLHKAVFQVQC